MQIIRSFSLCIFMVMAMESASFADPGLFPPKKPKPYVQKLYGTISLGDGIAASGSLFARDHSLYTIRYLHEDRALNSAPFWESTPRSHLDEIGIMYGGGFKIWRFFLDGSGGLAYINYSTDIAPQKIASGGLIANIQASYALKPWMGVGLELYGDLNLYQSRTGVLLNLHFGKVR